MFFTVLQVRKFTSFLFFSFYRSITIISELFNLFHAIFA